MKSKILLISCLVFVTSCANFNSIHRKTEIDDISSAVSVDAKQRFLISSTVVESTTDSSGNIIDKSYSKICAEPSPDTFSVFSAAIEADASKAEQLTAALKATTSESGATIGIRSEAIQLLRDAMFRLCEAYASGGLTSIEYSKMMGKYQKSMVTLIAISQLTGASAPAQLVLSNNSSIALSNKTFEAKEKLNNVRSELVEQRENNKKLVEMIQESESNMGKFSEKCPDGKAIEGIEQDECNAHKELLQNKQMSEANLARLEKDEAEWASVFENSNKATSLSTQAFSKAIESSSGQIDKDTIVALSTTIKGLVTEVFLDDLLNTCVEGMASLALTGADEIERNKSLSATQEGSNKLQAQASFLDICGKVIGKKLAVSAP